MTSSQTTAAPTGLRAWTPAQRFALVFGAVYLVVAVTGFALTGFSDFAGHHSHTLLIFAVNPLHNTIHLVLAIAWLAAAPRHSAARVVNLVIGVVLGLVTVLGFFGVLGTLGMSGLADPDNFLHLITATLALYFGSVAAGTPAGSQSSVSAR
ncbi:DUF4383 domain-containing protein [Blastococcus sp. CT_GayMR16]|uniref:DUF4383 domain-containing protein n=1 Tax=Blastococcus sp. CT_GayMR16 TaxID=2559607 RepID=UPI00107478C4|nr:DUF4383 domain-containing protein [Blastococcus sp. CT_GayMR16]TFV89891.1 DUF4383 domain-containing protein [Blastococcus sp. CT_GayMR16]